MNCRSFIRNCTCNKLLLALLLMIPLVFASELTLQTPANNTSSEDSMPIFSWTEVNNTSYYLLLISDSQTFAHNNYTFNITGSECQMAEELLPGKWYWKVIAFNNTSNISSETFIYTVVEQIEMFFDINTEKDEYNLSDDVIINISATEGSEVNIVITDGTNMENYTLTMGESCELITYTIENIGTHLITGFFTYGEETLTDMHFFEAVEEEPEELSVKIEVDDTIVEEGEVVYFEAIVENAVGDVDHEWDFDDDGIVDSEDNDHEFTYDIADEYTAKLRITDEDDNTAEDEVTITVEKMTFEVEVEVIDRDTKEPVARATVNFNSTYKRTNSDGIALFSLQEGYYLLEIEKKGYDDYAADYDIDQDETFTAKLKPAGSTARSTTNSYSGDFDIEILGPADGETLNENTVFFKYKVKNNAPIEACKLYINLNTQGMYEEQSAVGVRLNEELQFVQTDLEEKTYRWKIRCTDTNRKMVFSDEYSFNIASPTTTTTTSTSTTSTSTAFYEEPGYEGSDTEPMDDATGMSILENALDLAATSEFWIIIVLVGGLGSYAVFIYYKKSNKPKKPKQKKQKKPKTQKQKKNKKSFGIAGLFQDKQAKHIKTILAYLKELIRDKNYPKAAEIYNQVEELVPKMKKGARKKLEHELKHIEDELKLHYVLNMLNQLSDLVEKRKFEESAKLYPEIEAIEKTLPASYRHHVDHQLKVIEAKIKKAIS